MSGSNKKLFRPSSPPPPPPPPPKPSKFSINFQKPFEDLTKSFSRLLEANAATTTTEPSPAPSDLPPKLPPKKGVSKAATESDLLSFLFIPKKASKQQQHPLQSQKPPPPPLPPRNPVSFVLPPKRPTIPSGANMTKSELFNLLFPPRMNNKTTGGGRVSGGGTSSTRERRQRHSSPIFLTQKSKPMVPKKVSIVEPPKTDGKNMTSKPPLTSDLYSFFFHPRNKTTKILREPRQFRSYTEEDGRSSSSGRAGQLSSFGNSRSCSNLMSTTTTTSGGRQNFGDLNYPHSPQRGNSSLDDIWSTAPPTTNRQLATPLEPQRNDGPPKPPRARPPNAGPTSGSNKTNNSGTAAMTTVAARPSSAMPSRSSRQNLSLMTKRSVSMGSLNLNDFLTDGVQGVPGDGDLDLEDEDAKECTICCEKEVDSVFIPCGHMCLCFDCANEYRSSKKDGACPICRAPSTGVFRTFSA